MSPKLTPTRNTILCSSGVATLRPAIPRCTATAQATTSTTQDSPRFPHAYRLLAATYVCLGRLDDARKIVERLRAITPLVVEDFAYLRNPEQRELILSGLR